MRVVQLRYISIIWLSIFLASVAFAGSSSDVGTSTASFLKLGAGARVIGMGGAFVAVADDANATYWNPAGMTQIYSPEIAATHNQWFEDIRSEYVSYVHPLPDKMGVAGADFLYMSVPSIEKRDSSGDKAGTAKVNSMSYAVLYAYPVSPRFSAGIKLKGIFQEFDDEKGNGMAADCGLLFVQPVLEREKVSFGVNVQNLGPKLKTGSTDEDLPLNIKGGIAFISVDKGLIIAVDIDQPVDNKMKFHSGVEYWFRKLVALRVGYEDVGDIGAGSGFTFGCGFKGYESEEFSNVLIGFDYALASFGDFGYTHRFSLAVKF
ncbi:MAG: PorV/PorQ family protein [bacterium]